MTRNKGNYEDRQRAVELTIKAFPEVENVGSLLIVADYINNFLLHGDLPE